MDIIVKIYAEYYLIEKASFFEKSMREAWYYSRSLARDVRRAHGSLYVEVITKDGDFLFDFFVGRKPKKSKN